MESVLILKVALGVTLSLDLILLIGYLGGYCWWRRKNGKSRDKFGLIEEAVQKRDTDFKKNYAPKKDPTPRTPIGPSRPKKPRYKKKLLTGNLDSRYRPSESARVKSKSPDADLV